MTKFTFKGLMAPVFNAYNDDLSVNPDIIPEYSKYLSDRGIKGVLIHGSTGELSSLTLAERKSVAEVWVAAAKERNQHVMIQVGGLPLAEVKELAKHAEQIGADSILTLPELYLKPKTSQELIDYLKEIATVVPNLPLLYYHIPMWSDVHVNMEEFLNLSVGQIPNFHGIKFTSTDLAQGYFALKAAGGKYSVLLGADPLIQPATALGFDSYIATCINFMPEQFISILNALQENKVEESRRIQQNLTAAVKVITKNGTWIPTMKAAMNFLTPIQVGLARPPLKNLTPAQLKELHLELPKHTTKFV